jgi:tyrosyl-tRNA synthetase
MKSASEQMRLLERGVASIIPREELVAKLGPGKPLRVKLGVDPTAPDIHLGHTVVLQKMRQFQDLGHVGVLIIGTYTAMIGDPSGQSVTRPQLSEEQVLAAAATFKEQVFKILIPERTEVVHNGDWFAKLSFREVLELCSKYTVARMLERDDFAKRTRAEQPIGVHEFLYPLMQAYDSVQVEADVEIGGTDQTFNILLGRHLQREWQQPEQVAVIMPLLEGTDGAQKMSKSLGNYIGVVEPADVMFGKVMSISDRLMMRYYELLTDVDIADLQARTSTGGLHPMEAKKALAVTLVARFVGSAAAEGARADFERRFQRRELPEKMEEFVWPETDATAVSLAALVAAAGMAKSNSEARRKIQQGGVRVNGEPITDPRFVLHPSDGETCTVQVGTRRVKKIVFGGSASGEGA